MLFDPVECRVFRQHGTQTCLAVVLKTTDTPETTHNWFSYFCGKNLLHAGIVQYEYRICYADVTFRDLIEITKNKNTRNHSKRVGQKLRSNGNVPGLCSGGPGYNSTPEGQLF